MVRTVKLSDAAAIAEIYNYYILHTVITFEEEPITAEEMLQRIQAVHPTLPWLVYDQDGEVLGYAYASLWNKRIGYRFTAETSIYLKHGTGGKGIGSQLYKILIDQLEKWGFMLLLVASAFPMMPANVCTKNSALKKWPILKAPAINSINGSMLDTGSCYWKEMLSQIKLQSSRAFG